MSNLRRILLSVALLAIAGAMGFGLYWLFFRTPIQPPVNPPVEPGNGLFPPAGPGGQITPTSTGRFPITPDDGVGPYVATGTTDTIAGATTAAGGSLRYYDSLRRQFVNLAADGSITPLSPDKFFGVSNVTWAPGNTKAIVAYPDGSKVLYDFATQQQSTLPKEMTSFSFDPSGTRLASLYLGSSPEEQWLVVSNADGSQIQLVEAVGGKAQNFTPSWAPNGQIVGLFAEAVDGNRQEVIPIGRNGENFRSFLAPGRGFTASWSPSGERVLYSVHNDQTQGRPELYLGDGRADSFGSNSTNLGLSTSADWCSFSGTSVYCAALNNPPALLNTYPELAVGQPASLWRIDLASGQRTLVSSLPEGFTPSAVLVGEGGVYVADQITGRLYAAPTQ
jgi:hypothetical protein